MINLPLGIHVLGRGPAVILLHSSLSSSKQWLPLVECLKTRFKVINIDILGYGAAEAVAEPQSYNFSIEIERIQEALQQVIPNEAYHIVGHSCGGALALKLAVENPSHVLSLSLYEPVAFHLLPQGSEARIAANKFAQEVNIGDLYLAAEKFTDFWNAKGFFRKLPERMQQLMAKDMEKVNLDFIGLTAETYGSDDINKIKSPVMMMTGNQSPQLSKTLAALIVTSLDNVKEVSFEAGHMGPVSHASTIQPKIAEFIRDC
ncbi:alpha/beta fold hydrolase [Colwellia sp. UCD-KL20]|uniref:alpha/beta fold hydrolase n=1 Tax=Colwellia sp. UCD-KL20 TaxID=1917165 RepID=UPI0009FA8DEA|nr:alpha/beta fold hydrolase [Colwellia sp. UCD-KL20]